MNQQSTSPNALPWIPYARVSKAEHDYLSQSLEQQAAALKRFGESKGILLEPVARCEVVSGKKIANRKVIRQALMDVKEGRAAGIVILRHDRVTRAGGLDWYNHFEPLRKSGKLLLVESSNDNSPQTAAVDAILIEIAKLDGALISMRTSQILREMVKAGKHVGRPPYGYMAVKEGEKKSLRPDPDRFWCLQVLRLAWSRGFTSNRLLDLAVATEMPPPAGNGESGWNIRTLSRLMLRFKKDGGEVKGLDEIEIPSRIKPKVIFRLR